MKGIRLTSGDVCEIAGVTLSMLDRWAAAWLVGKARGGEGHGFHRTYSPVEALAITAGNRWRMLGADPGRVAGVVRFVGRLSLEQLEAELTAGRTFPVPAVMVGELELPGVGGIMVEPPLNSPGLDPQARELMRKLDLGCCWSEVKRKIARLASRPGRRRRGPKGKRARVSN